MQDGEWSGSEEEDGEEEYDEEDYGSEEDVLEVELRGEESGDETGYESLDEEWADPADALAEPVDVHPAETFESAAALPPFEGLPPLDGLAEPLPPPQAKPSSNSLWGAALASALASAGGFLSRASDRLSGTGTPLPDPKPELESGIANLTLGGPSYVPPMRASNAIFPVVPDPDSPSYAGPGERVEELWGERRCHGLFGWRRSDGTEVLTFSRPVKTAELVVWQDGDKAIFGINSGARIEGIFGSSVRVWSYVGAGGSRIGRRVRHGLIGTCAGNNVRYCVRATLK
ncbi:hypothetical protein DFJ74DRAFT_696335 [Hyaloraphidium curvatum]|nr:hypothetical protein DFJ74DRAFT_696335 [Hyaloraphidium curvatum]